MKSSLDVQSRFFTFFTMHYILEIKAEFQVVSQFSCFFFGHPVGGRGGGGLSRMQGSRISYYKLLLLLYPRITP